MIVVTSCVPASATSIGGALASLDEYSHTTAAVGGAETKSRSVVGGTIASAGHRSVAGQTDGGAVAETVALVGGSDGADRALPTGGAAHDANAAIDKAATETSPINAADARARSCTNRPPTSSDARSPWKVARPS